MKSQKVRDLDSNEIKVQLRDMEEQKFRIKFQMSMGQMEGVDHATASAAMRLAAHKLPIPTKIVFREASE